MQCRLTNAVILSLLILALSGTALCQQKPSKSTAKDGVKPAPASQNQDTRRDYAVGLIDSAVASAEGFDAESSNLILLSAGDALAGIDDSRASEYWKAAFRAAQRLPLIDSRGLRIALQEAAVARMVKANPDLGADYLRLVDKPHFTETSDEDIRGRTGQILVNRFLERNRKGDPEKAGDVISYLADTGEFPYRAAGDMLQFYQKHDATEMCSDMFAKMLAHFSLDAGFKNSPVEFAGVVSHAPKCVPEPLLSDAIRSIIDESQRLERNRPTTDGHQANALPTLVLSSKKGEIQLPGLSTYLAFELLPVAQRVDAQLAKRLKNNDSTLKRITESGVEDSSDPWSQSAPYWVWGQVTPDRLAKIRQTETERNELRRLRDIAKKSPDAALAEASGLENTVERCHALAAVTEALSNANLTQVRGFLHQTESCVSVAQNTQARIEAMIQLAELYRKLGDSEEATSTLSSAFSLGADTFEKEEQPLEAQSLPTLLPSISSLSHVSRALSLIDLGLATKLSQSLSEPRAVAYLELAVANETLHLPTTAPRDSQMNGAPNQ